MTAVELGGTKDVRNLTFTVGHFSAKDIFDTNAYANDPRSQFMNWVLGGQWRLGLSGEHAGVHQWRSRRIEYPRMDRAAGRLPGVESRERNSPGLELGPCLVWGRRK